MRMLSTMAISTQSDQVLWSVIPQSAAKFPMVGLQVSGRPTHLTSPSIPLKDFFAKQTILVCIELQPWFSLAQFSHAILNHYID
jgi:hypothetical protein